MSRLRFDIVVDGWGWGRVRRSDLGPAVNITCTYDQFVGALNAQDPTIAAVFSSSPEMESGLRQSCRVAESTEAMGPADSEQPRESAVPWSYPRRLQHLQQLLNGFPRFTAYEPRFLPSRGPTPRHGRCTQKFRHARWLGERRSTGGRVAVPVAVHTPREYALRGGRGSPISALLRSACYFQRTIHIVRVARVSLDNVQTRRCRGDGCSVRWHTGGSHEVPFDGAGRRNDCSAASRADR